MQNRLFDSSFIIPESKHKTKSYLIQCYIIPVAFLSFLGIPIKSQLPGAQTTWLIPSTSPRHPHRSFPHAMRHCHPPTKDNAKNKDSLPLSIDSMAHKSR